MGYTAQQAGMALSPGGIVIIALLPFVGRMVSKVDTRYLVAIGFLVLSASLFYMARVVNVQMDFRTAVELRMMQSVGMAFLFVPIQTISYSGVPVQKNNQVSGIMNLSRNLGADLGISFVTTLIARRSQTHQANLVRHTTAYDPAYQAKVSGIARALTTAGATSIDAAKEATAAMYRQLLQQASQLAYLDALYVLGLAAALMTPIVWLTKRPGPMGASAVH
jgi:MFS transporter, DHA2 family, multidrug resistance protein